MNEEEIREKLSDPEYKVLREKGTEPPGSGKHLETTEDGLFKCKVCGTPLFKSKDKFESNKWPSFKKAIEKNIKFEEDKSKGLNRTEVLCNECGSHLGHIFDDGPEPTGKRFCINSVCLKFDDQKN